MAYKSQMREKEEENRREENIDLLLVEVAKGPFATSAVIPAA